MKNLNYKVAGSDVILYQRDFDLSQTLDCGQAFRWEKTAENEFSGYYLDKFLKISGSNGEFVLHNTTEEDFLSLWAKYLDLDTDYCEIKKLYSYNETLKKACDHSYGIRLLRQDPWETLVSYIFSQNNNIPRIKGIISRLVEHYGVFPTADMLSKETPESLGFLRSGFRAKYIVDCATKVVNCEVDLDKCFFAPLDEARRELMKIKGVGPKVADCTLLYGFSRRDAFPVDVWIKRAMAELFPEGLPEEVKGSEGIAQLYIFNYIRNIDKENEK